MQSRDLITALTALRTAINSVDAGDFGALVLQVASSLENGAPALVHEALATVENELLPREKNEVND